MKDMVTDTVTNTDLSTKNNGHLSVQYVAKIKKETISMSEFNVDLNVARSTDKGPIIQGEKGEVVKYLVLGALYVLMFTVMVSCNGWRMGMGIAVALFAPLIIFGGLFWLCGCRSNYCCNTSNGGYRYRFRNRYGSKYPK
jgi:multidrug efflux pump subunit AcrB